jgi:hypothetical protein
VPPAILYSVAEERPGYFTYLVTLHPEGAGPTRQASGAFRTEAQAERAAADGVEAIQHRLELNGFARIEERRYGTSPLRRRAERSARELGRWIAFLTSSVTLTIVALALIALIRRVW